MHSESEAARKQQESELSIKNARMQELEGMLRQRDCDIAEVSKRSDAVSQEFAATVREISELSDAALRDRGSLILAFLVERQQELTVHLTAAGAEQADLQATLAVSVKERETQSQRIVELRTECTTLREEAESLRALSLTQTEEVKALKVRCLHIPVRRNWLMRCLLVSERASGAGSACRA